MSDSYGIAHIDDNSSLYEILKNCASFQSYDSLPVEDFNDVCFHAEYNSCANIYLENFPKMLPSNQCSVSGNISCSNTSVDSLSGNIIDENGRISLAYENLRTIPRQIAEKFALRAKFLDLSHNNFQNISFLSIFQLLDTLVLDRNSNLDVNTFPLLQNLKILWINNCDIKNVVEWINRIQVQCPNLEHLSIMGNPGISEPFNLNNLNILNNITNVESNVVPANKVTDYREFIIRMLPNLKYLDGVLCSKIQKTFQCPTHDAGPSTSTSSTSPAVLMDNASTSQGKQSNTKTNPKSSPSFSFKNLFLFKRRRKSNPSSSTN